MNLPEAKKTDLLTTELEDEVVVYDPERKQAHSLNRTAMAVWNQCDGQTSIADLRRRVSSEIGAPISEAAVWLALRKLERAHLLTEKLVSAEPITRRHVLGQAGRLGAAAMVATPIVISAAVPAAAQICSRCSITLPVGNPTGSSVCLCVHTTDAVPLAVCVADQPTTTACTTSADCAIGQHCVTRQINGGPVQKLCFFDCLNLICQCA